MISQKWHKASRNISSIGGFRNDFIIAVEAPMKRYIISTGWDPNINHFSTQGSAGGPGMLNVDFIREVTLSASAFGAEYDNPLSEEQLLNNVMGPPKKQLPKCVLAQAKRSP